MIMIMKKYSGTDEKIINATFEILQEEGFAKATTKKIAAKAGVNEVTISETLKTKTIWLKPQKSIICIY